MSKTNNILSLLSSLKTFQRVHIPTFTHANHVSERTLLRYVKNLKDVGIKLHRDGEFIIQKEDCFFGLDITFTKEELLFIQRQVQAMTANDTLAKNIAGKLMHLKGDILLDRPIENHLAQSTFIERINKAIQSGKCIQLVAYQSLHSKKLIDPVLEPLQFDAFHKYLLAYDLAAEKVKQYKISRMGGVEVLEHAIEKCKYWLPMPIDPFGISGNEVINVQLDVSERAKLLMQEEFEIAEDYFEARPKNRWVFTGKVQGLQGIGRYIMGLFHEIDVLEPMELQDYVILHILKGLKDENEKYY